MVEHVNLVKLCVGAETVADLLDWQGSGRANGADGLPRHVTRMWPRRDAALLAGGSLYWVIKGVIECRQRIVRLDEVTGDDGIRRCGIVLERDVIRTQGALRRPFQGWRYLDTAAAPPDLRPGQSREEALPPELNRALAEIGVI